MAPAPSQRRVLEALLPWLVGVAGAALFLRPLLAAPGASVLDRVFWHDSLLNIDILADLYANLSRGPDGEGFYDWLYAGRLFFPQPRPLVTSELLLLPALLTYWLKSEPVLAHNLVLFGALVLDCVAGARLARTLGATPVAATAAGAAFTFCAYTNFVSARVQLVALFPLAFALDAVVRWARTGGWREAWAASLWTAAQALLCLYYALFLALLLPLVTIAARAALPRAGLRRDATRLAVTLGTVFAPLVALLWPFRQLRSELGLVRNYSEVVGQSGDPSMFFWADASTLWGAVLADRLRWDSAYFPGLTVLAGAFAAVVLWACRDPKLRGPMVGLALLGAAGGLLDVSVALVAFAAAVVWLVALARRGRVSQAAPLVALLALVGLFLFLGPKPQAFGRPIGHSPFQLLYFHAPFFDGLRMIRRAGVLVQLALCLAAALALTRLERRRYGPALVAALVVAVLVEGLPFGIGAQPVASSCVEPALLAARAGGITAVGDVSDLEHDHRTRAHRRHHATLCGVNTTGGLSGFDTALAELTDDALMVLPDPAAHAWLWDAGVRHVVVRRGRSDAYYARRLERLASITASRSDFEDGAVLLALTEPPFRATGAEEAVPGAALPITSVTCVGAGECREVADGSPNTRWAGIAQQSPHDVVELSFAPAVVHGLEWVAGRHAGELPRGLRIERRDEQGAWVPWREVPALSPLHLGRRANPARYALRLPEAWTTGMRLVNLGESRKYRLGAAELRVFGVPAQPRSAPAVQR